MTVPWGDPELIAELSHLINSPLAAIRNALYLAASRSSDPDLHRYLSLADREVDSISNTLQQARLQSEQELSERKYGATVSPQLAPEFSQKAAA